MVDERQNRDVRASGYTSVSEASVCVLEVAYSRTFVTDGILARTSVWKDGSKGFRAASTGCSACARFLMFAIVLLAAVGAAAGGSCGGAMVEVEGRAAGQSRAPPAWGCAGVSKLLQLAHAGGGPPVARGAQGVLATESVVRPARCSAGGTSGASVVPRALARCKPEVRRRWDDTRTLRIMGDPCGHIIAAISNGG
jgi:hypothetical protein